MDLLWTEPLCAHTHTHTHTYTLPPPDSLCEDSTPCMAIFGDEAPTEVIQANCGHESGALIQQE